MHQILNLINLSFKKVLILQEEVELPRTVILELNGLEKMSSRQMPALVVERLPPTPTHPEGPFLCLAADNQ